MRSATARNPLRAVLLGFTLAIAAALMVATPASAHDELVGSTPAPNEQLAAAPAQVVLTYSAAILPDGAAITVVDAAGRDWVAGEPVIETNTLTAAIGTGTTPPDGGYIVEWRVVSSDGHPISGTIPFAVGDAEPLASAPPIEQPGSAAPAATAEGQGDPGMALTLTAFAFIAIVAVLAVVVFARRRKGEHPAP
ncbi:MULTISPECIES: copper resistance protein CopC [unclassified Microbacterium]|uniref:copper resistance CopC family protein n=1 Tax=unclassified Microbacterium TaxID=2609290 RepID=UPI0038651169